MTRLSIFLIALTSTALLIGTSGCYTRVATSGGYHSYDTPQYSEYDENQDYPDYSETYTDSSGNVLTENYYYSDATRSSVYFDYYWPTYWGSYWSYGYNPYWNWYYPPYWGGGCWATPYYCYGGGWGWGYYPGWGGGGYWGGGSYYHSSPYLTTSRSGTRVRTTGNTRSLSSRTRTYANDRGSAALRSRSESAGYATSGSSRSRTDASGSVS